MVMGPNGEFVPATVFGVPIPNFWASNATVEGLIRYVIISAL